MKKEKQKGPTQMYKNFFGFKKRSFKLVPYSAYLFLSKSHEEALAHFKRVMSKLRINMLFFIIFAIVILTVGAVPILSQKPREKASSIVVKNEIKPAKPVSLPEKKVSMSDLTNKEMSSKKDVEKAEPIAKAVKMTSISVPKPQKKSLALVSQTEIKSSKHLSSPKNKPAIQDLLQKETTTSKDVEKSEQNTEAERFASIPVKQAGETGLKLQAIAWSSDSKNRLVVINGNIVREGESIEEVFVEHIGKNEVIFKNGREEWRQLFRLK